MEYNDFFILNICIKSVIKNQKCEFEIDLLKQENARLMAKNYELEAEIARLKQIIEENARRDARVEELEQKNKEFEAKLAILEQDVDLSNTEVEQQNNVDTKTSKKIEIDAFLVEEDLSMTSAKPVILPEQVVKESTPAGP
ncbi:unnamed protein product [Rhizophagus irregularis]|uniref:Uncharacterized protein n=1 Tax=Rhizophagus irregularis TaxID=588596 RepID=A0A2I1HHX1_9GLOM|nr:hypothetical protein RhiirA4_480388 [Rhizophagus irregularis]CAB4442580.1 unnamed protein product [Rhizophagus irregularis]